MEKYCFMNTIYAETDSFGSWDDEWVALGFKNYYAKDGEKSEYSFDEVEELLKNNEIKYDNFYRDKNEKLRLINSYLSAETCFSIVCGKIINSKFPELEKYAKKIGVASNEFKGMKGWFGTKTMNEDEDGLYNIQYKLNHITDNVNIDYIEKILVGAIKKICGKRIKNHSSKGVEIEKFFECKSVVFNKVNRTLFIEGIEEKYITGSIVACIKNLDLELWMLFNPNKEWSRFFDAAISCVRDNGQQHWFRRMADVGHINFSGKDRESNYDWYEKELGEEWN